MKTGLIFHGQASTWAVVKRIQIPLFTAQVPSLSVAARQFSTCSQLNGAKAAFGEISSILED